MNAFENKSILIVTCHQDDETLFAGGLLSQAADLNSKIHISCLIPPAPGRRDTDTRVAALKQVARHSGATVQQHETDMSGLPRMRRYVKTRREPPHLADRPRSGAQKHPKFNEFKDAVATEIARHKPDVVITHNELGEYGHHEHAFLNAVVADIAAGDRSRRWMVFGNGLSRDTQAIDYRPDAKARLFEYYLPQWNGMKKYPFALEAETYADLAAAPSAPLVGRRSSEGASRPITFDEYEAAFETFGGSFATHPKVLLALKELAEIPITFHGLYGDGELVGAVPLADRFVMANGRALRVLGKRNIIDIGQSEVVLPIAAGQRVEVPGQGLFISDLTAKRATNAVPDRKRQFAIAKGIFQGDDRMSTKSRKKRLKETDALLADGGKFIPAQDLSPAEFAREYRRLFHLRRGTMPPDDRLLEDVLTRLHGLLSGDVLLVGDRPVGISLLYRVQSPDAVFVNAVNSPIDPTFRDRVAGNVLAFRNITTHEQQAAVLGLRLRYCRGRMSAEYKESWCHAVDAYVTRPQA